MTAKRSKSRQERLNRMVFILNAFIFLMGALSFIQQGKLWFGMIQVIAGLLNLLMLSQFLSHKKKQSLNYLIYVVNILVAITISIDYFQAGAKYIQYVWILTAVVSLVALIIVYKRDKVKATLKTTTS